MFVELNSAVLIERKLLSKKSGAAVDVGETIGAVPEITNMSVTAEEKIEMLLFVCFGCGKTEDVFCVFAEISIIVSIVILLFRILGGCVSHPIKKFERDDIVGHKFKRERFDKKFITFISKLTNFNVVAMRKIKFLPINVSNQMVSMNKDVFQFVVMAKRLEQFF